MATLVAKMTFSRFFLLATLCLPRFASADSPRLQETWETGYTKDDATGAHVLGYWKFDGDDALMDSSGKGNDLTLHGAVTVAKGKFGGALESFPGYPVQDKDHSAHTGPKARLSPKAGFTLEMWVNAKPEMDAKLRPFLLDKKYVDHTDYQWVLGEADKGGMRRMTANLGFGTESQLFNSLPVKLEPGTWHHLAFTYDGAGEGKFYLDGRSAGVARRPGFGAVAPGTKPLSIGDRLGSNYGGFPGYIDEVRICEGVLSFEQVALRIASTRSVWRRMETLKPVEVIVTNLRRTAMTNAKVHLNFDAKEEVAMIKSLEPGKDFIIKESVNSALKPDVYTLRARFELDGYSTEQSAEFRIMPRPVPGQMPVIMWGAGNDEMARLKDIGFTHYIGIHAEVGDIWTEGKPLPPGKPELIESTRKALDAALANGLNVVAGLSPGGQFESNPKYQRVDRKGVPYTRTDICASMPEFAPFFENVGRSVAKAYGDHPAFAAALIDSEVRDGSQPSFNAVDVENYRKFAGTDIPAEVVARSGVMWDKLKDFPKDRVIADTDPLLKYYRWFWTVGDGWNGLHSALNKGIKSTGRRDLFTWFDPAVRQPSISGAGGAVDVIAHWTYTYPAPLSIGLCADQLLAMSAAGGHKQQVMKMTQLIWYRSQTAPIAASAPGNVVAWEDHDPEAAYITIAPMHLREAFWTKIARPIQGIMYHGWQSLVPTDSTGAYRYTNANTVHVLKDLIHDVVVPLGPTLTQIPDERSQVALFESFTAQMFARRGSYGNNSGWPADVWLALQHAHVQCDLLFEESLLKGGLDGRKVLFMPECDVLTTGLVTKIAAWQKRGGKIVADEFLCPALKADVVLPSFKRTKKADQDKAKVLELARTLGPQVEALGLAPHPSCDNPEIIVRTRKYGDTTYVFVVNDKRESGTYVGQHGLVMENGLPSSGRITLPTQEANVYDLTRGSQVVPQRVDAGVSWQVDLGPCDGRIFMVTPKPLIELEVTAPETAKAGNTATIAIAITDTRKSPVKAMVPVQVEVRDANGKPAEGDGYYSAKDGTLSLKLDIAANEDPGVWTVRVRELASRMEQTKYVRVER